MCPALAKRFAGVGVTFAIGPAVQSLRGYGVPIRDEKGGLVIFIEFASRVDAENAEADLKRGLFGALRIRNAQGQQWPTALASVAALREA
jgi:hypothetical protein